MFDLFRIKIAGDDEEESREEGEGLGRGGRGSQVCSRPPVIS